MGANAKLPGNFVLTALLTTGITLTVSIIYLVLCIISLIFQLQCDDIQTDVGGSAYFINTLYRVYLQAESCESAIDWEGTTSPRSVLILVIITIFTSICGIIAASILMTAVSSAEWARYVVPAVYAYCGVYAICIVVDITFATHFGIDQSNLAIELDASSPGVSMNYIRDMLRLGSLLLMIVALKGIVVHVINIALIIMLIVFLANHSEELAKGHHPIHRLGALNAFEQDNRKNDDNWQTRTESRGAQTNLGYNTSEPPTLERNPTSYNNSRGYERSDSWLPQPTGLAGSRPFSYLEEVRRPVPVRSPTVDQQWRDWPPAPSVPAPDYSPHNARKLKPALKLNYM